MADRIYEDGSLGVGPDKIFDSKHPLLQKEVLASILSLFKNPPPFRKKAIETNVYIRLPQKRYAENLYPETKLRLLGLFNFWNVIYYFSPHKKLITGSWDNALNYFIPRFIFAKDYKSYYWMLRELSARLNDGHAEITLNHSLIPPKDINNYYAPFCVKYLEGKTVVARLVHDSTQIDPINKLNIGDEILAIDGIKVKELYEQWRQYVGGSNEPHYYIPLHKIPLLSRSGTKNIEVTYLHNGKKKITSLKPVSQDAYMKGFMKVYYPTIAAPYWKNLNDSTGYVRLNNIYSNQVDSVWLTLKEKKYIILDARGYPKDANIVKTIVAPFIKKIDTVCINTFPEITHPLLSRNAITIEAETVSPAPFNVKVPNNKKFILLCANGNGSQAETNIISLQKILHPITIGTQTVGANGVYNTILLPGGYAGHYSGFAVYYTDGTPNQQLGVKIDIPVDITIKGDLNGKDEILERAMNYIKYAK